MPKYGFILAADDEADIGFNQSTFILPIINNHSRNQNQ